MNIQRFLAHFSPSITALNPSFARLSLRFVAVFMLVLFTVGCSSTPPKLSNPIWFDQSLAEIAEYYDQYDEVRGWLDGVQVRYEKGAMRTEFKSNRVEVFDIVVYFDPRTAIKVSNRKHCKRDPSHCVVTPADALIHELLHVRSPQAGEHVIVAQHKRVRAAMTKKDGVARALISDGNLAMIQVKCARCVR